MSTYTVEIEKDGKTYEVDIDGPGPSASTSSSIPPLPNPPTAAEVLSRTVQPPIPKADALSLPNLVKSAGENLLPPGVAFKNGLPVLSMDSLKRGMSPVAGQYGLSAPLEAAGSKLSNAYNSAIETAVTDNPLARNYPNATAAATFLPVDLSEKLVPMFAQPSGIQQNVGAAGMGLAANMNLPTSFKAASAATPKQSAAYAKSGFVEAAGPSIKDVGKGLIAKYGQFAHGFNPEATQQAIKNPEVMKSGFAGADKFERVASGLKKALDDVSKKINSAYEVLKSKLDKPNKITKAVGKVDFEDVVKPLEEAKTKLKVDVPGTSKIEPGEVARFKKLEKEVLEQSDMKSLEDFFKGRPKNQKFGANEMLDFRHRIDREIYSKESSPFFKAKMKELRAQVDTAIRDRYPEIKDLDAKTSPVMRAEKTIKRRLGIKAGEEVTPAQAENVERTSRYLFGPGRETLRKGLSEAGSKVGGAKAIEDLKDLGAAGVFDPTKDPNFTLFNWIANTRKAAKFLFKTGIKASKSASHIAGKSSQLLPAITNYSRNKREK